MLLLLLLLLLFFFFGFYFVISYIKATSLFMFSKKTLLFSSLSFKKISKKRILSNNMHYFFMFESTCKLKYKINVKLDVIIGWNNLNLFLLYQVNT